MMDEFDEDDPGTEEWVAKERDVSLCPCKSRLPYAGCCQPFHHGKAKPETAEQLMRSRYSAYFFRLVDYLVETTHPDTREPPTQGGIGKHHSSGELEFFNHPLHHSW